MKRGGTVSIVTHTIEVRCRADAIPTGIDVDVSELEINYSKHLSDITLPEGVRVVATRDITLVTVVPPSAQTRTSIRWPGTGGTKWALNGPQPE